MTWSSPPKAQQRLIRAIGTNKEQLKSVKGLSGDVGQANFSNYLTVAKNMIEEKQVVLMADKQSHVISNIIIPKKDFIPVDGFLISLRCLSIQQDSKWKRWKAQR